MEAVTGGVEPDEEHGSVRPLRNTLSQLRLRELLTEVQDRVEQIVQGRDRLDGLVDAMLVVTSGLDLDSTLRTFVRARRQGRLEGSPLDSRGYPTADSACHTSRPILSCRDQLSKLGGDDVDTAAKPAHRQLARRCQSIRCCAADAQDGCSAGDGLVGKFGLPDPFDVVLNNMIDSAGIDCLAVSLARHRNCCSDAGS
jgi:hypothetical protein